MSAFPQLSPALARLPSGPRRLWGDAEVRRQALLAVVDAWGTGSADLGRAIGIVDSGVALGLTALGLPRGPVSEVRIDSGRLGLSGQKLRDCVIVLVGDTMRVFVRERNQADAVFRTWIHESLHARQPYAPNALAEYRAFRGYEEGLVEGLTQIALAAAGISVSDAPFGGYVAAYRALAMAAGIGLEGLLRSLWRYPAGEVRQQLPEVAGTLYERASGAAMPPQARLMVQTIGDRLYATDRGSHTRDETLLVALWRRAFA